MKWRCKRVVLVLQLWQTTQSSRNEEGNDKCKWSKLLKEKEIAFARGYRTVLFPPIVVSVDGHGPMGF